MNYLFKELLREAREAGAALVGGVDVIGNIQSGDIKITDYQFILAHPNILPDMVAVRGLMKRKFPNPRSGTLGVNLNEMVSQFLTGIQYKSVRDDFQHNYGKITTSIGTVSLSIELCGEDSDQKMYGKSRCYEKSVSPILPALSFLISFYHS